MELLRKFASWFGLGKSERTAVDQDSTSTSMKHKDLLGERLAQAGVDQDYVRDSNPELIQALENVCASCPNPEKCRHDLESGNWEAGQANYCPNADKIDRLIVGRPR